VSVVVAAGLAKANSRFFLVLQLANDNAMRMKNIND
jgi:hypothetical protein